MFNKDYLDKAKKNRERIDHLHLEEEKVEKRKLARMTISEILDLNTGELDI